MCGIVGLISPHAVDPAMIAAMTATLRHRGPDDAGEWLSEDRRVAFGHRRLAILDLSAAGQQPMASADGRLTICYNGEIYNHLELRADLEASGSAPSWRGHSDTETLLAAISSWGLEQTLWRASGMFAFALWDRQANELSLARDRFGEKPLYFGGIEESFAFASELKALKVHPGFAAKIDPVALRQLLGRGYIGRGRSIWQGIRQLSPGCLMRVKPGIAVADAREEAWYDFAGEVHAGAAQPIASEEEALEQLEAALSQSVSRQLVADVPVGVFLSGGIDSSLVTALAARGAGKVSSFTIGFAEAGYDEAPDARAVATHLGTEHHELRVDPQATRDVIPLLPTIFDEPFGDSSQIPTYLVSHFARQQVTVALSGDGADELFGGYNRHRALPAMWRRAGVLPKPLRGGLADLGGQVPPGLWNVLAGVASKREQAGFLGNKVQRALRALGGAASFAELHAAFLDEWHGMPSPLAKPAPFVGPIVMGSGLALEAEVMLADALDYLPGDILTKVDRASMAVSLETRAPYLAPEVAQVAARIPAKLHFADGRGKAVLRGLLYRMVPRELVDRPKAGFAIPVGEWIKGPLRGWAEELLEPQRLAEGGLLAPEPIRARWEAHLAGREDATQALWPVLMFQAWRQPR